MKHWQESLVLYNSFSARWLHCFFAQAQIYTLLIIRSSQIHRILVAKLGPITNRLAIVPDLSSAGFVTTRADLLAQPLILSSRMLISIYLHNKLSVSVVAEFLAYLLIFGTAIFAFCYHICYILSVLLLVC